VTLNYFPAGIRESVIAGPACPLPNFNRSASGKRGDRQVISKNGRLAFRVIPGRWIILLTPDLGSTDSRLRKALPKTSEGFERMMRFREKRQKSMWRVQFCLELAQI
jgi:hypothetical protein